MELQHGRVVRSETPPHSGQRYREAESSPAQKFMGKNNLAINRLLERKPIFADFINGTVFQGEQKRLLKIIREKKKEESINELNRRLLADNRHAALFLSGSKGIMRQPSNSTIFYNPSAFPVNKQVKQCHTDPSNGSTNGNGLETTAFQ